MNDQQQQINGKPLITSLGWNRIQPVLVRNGAKSVYLVCQNTFKMQTDL